MLMSLFAATVAGFFAIPTVVDSGATPPRAKVQEAKNADAVVCRIVAPPTGTILGARHECRSTGEWIAIHQDASRRVNDAQQISLTSSYLGGH
jgi:hypothetical protein